jgi:hypothetical protein
MDQPDRDFNVGEEVLFEGERFVIAGRAAGPAYGYRLLATAPGGVRVAWAERSELVGLARYTTPDDDTARR